MREAPPRAVVLYDGHCQFCQSSVDLLVRLLGPERVAPRSFQDPAVLAEYPTLTHEACMARMHAVLPNGAIYRGAEAFARLLTSVPVFGILFFLYYVPPLNLLAEALYTVVARLRYRLFGRSTACKGGTCSLHGR
jgi:predicted DCC family thiol-disulfide oxidoreductase YuxK